MNFPFSGNHDREPDPGHERGRQHRHRRGAARRLTLDEVGHARMFRVVRLAATGEIRRRLVDMGFVRGSIGRVLREALLKDPIELEMLGYKVSLRRSEAREIFVEEIE